MDAYDFTCAVNGLHKIRDALLATETATGRKFTPGRLEIVERKQGELAMWFATDLEHAAKLGIDLSQLASQARDRIEELKTEWVAAHEKANQAVAEMIATQHAEMAAFERKRVADRINEGLKAIKKQK